MCKIIVLVGATASGKDTILNNVLKRNKELKSVISTTSRPIRDKEVDGVTYKFRSYEEVKNMFDDNEFIEHRIYNVANGDEWIYGITKDEIDINSDNKYIVIVDIQGLESIENYFKENGLEKNVVSIFIDCEAKTRLNRALERELFMSDDKVSEICRRNLDDMDKVVNPAKEKCVFRLKNSDEHDLEFAVQFITNLLYAM